MLSFQTFFLYIGIIWNIPWNQFLNNVKVKSGIVTTPSSSGINEIFALETMSSDQKKYRDSLKLPGKPLELNSFFKWKIIAWLIEEGSFLYPMNKTLEEKGRIKPQIR